MKFRIKHRSDKGYYAQVSSLFGWYTIKYYKHLECEYGLTHVDDEDYPMATEEEALERVKGYFMFLMRNKKVKRTYKYFTKKQVEELCGENG